MSGPSQGFDGEVRQRLKLTSLGTNLFQYTRGLTLIVPATYKVNNGPALEYKGDTVAVRCIQGDNSEAANSDDGNASITELEAADEV